MILKFNNFINENVEDKPSLHYYAFDWDDNILNMPTVIHMDHLVNGNWVPTDVSTADFAEVRGDSENWRIANNNADDAFCEFRDFGPRGDVAFLEDAKAAINSGSFGPAWDDFIECLTNGSLFAIITARGHEAPAMRKGVEWIIDNVLSDDELYEMYNNLKKFAYLYNDDTEHERMLTGKPSENTLIEEYLDRCDYIGVSAPSRTKSGSALNPEKAKEEALLDFSAKINRAAANIGLQAKIGFSDDDLKNVKHIEDLVDTLHSEKFPQIAQFVVKGTNMKGFTKKIKTFETFSQTTGLESSVISAIPDYNLMIASNKDTGGPLSSDNTRQDTYGNRLKNDAKRLGNQEIEYCEDCESEKCLCKN